MSDFGQNLTKLMRERGVTARVISQATGIPASTLSEWTGGRDPKLNGAVVKLAKFFGVSLEFLVSGTEPEHGLVAEMLAAATEEFALVFQGVYRLKVEKLVGSVGSAKKSGDGHDD